jgi:hypothetical protein
LRHVVVSTAMRRLVVRSVRALGSVLRAMNEPRHCTDPR